MWWNQIQQKGKVWRVEIQVIRVKVSTNPVSDVYKHHHIQRRTAQPRILNATSVGREDISRVAAHPRKGKRSWDSKRHGKVKACKGLPADYKRSSGTMETAVVYSFISAKQHITPHLFKVKSLNQHSTIYKQCMSTVWTSRKTTGICGHFGCQHNSTYRHASLTV